MAKKRSGRKASTIAGRVLAEHKRDGYSFWAMKLTKSRASVRREVTLDVLTLAASVLAQDEVKGQRPKRRRGRK